MSEHHSVIVIGAGLSGLYAAWKLHKQQQDVILLEARERIGGRILSPVIEGVDAGDQLGRVDMGPAWVWPQMQPRLQQLVTELDVKLFRQFTQGEMLYERNANDIQRYAGPSSHSQSYRISGGNSALTEALRNRLDDSSVHLNTRVSSIEQRGLSVRTVRDGKNSVYTAEKIILALPLRLSQQRIVFEPALDTKVFDAWKNTPTWMAGHCKIMFIYDRPFWREQNLSGEVFSQQGPLSEIYDGSPDNESFYALTSFVGLTASQRQQLKEEQLIELCLGQLRRLFGEESQLIKQVLFKDWSIETYTATELDVTGRPQHPEYSGAMARDLWNGKLILAGTESARENGGYLEGALESTDEALSILGF